MYLFQGGVQNNVIPQEFSAVFDVRLQPIHHPDEFETTVKRWCEEAGPGVTYSIIEANPKIMGTKLDSNPFWTAFANVFSNIGQLKTYVLPAATDARFLRQVSIELLLVLHVNSGLVNTGFSLKKYDLKKYDEVEEICRVSGIVSKMDV